MNNFLREFLLKAHPFQMLVFWIIVFILPYYFLAKYHLWEKFKIKLTPVFVVLFLSVSLAPSILISIYGYNSSKGVMVTEAQGYIKNVSYTLANNITLFFNKRINEIDYLANTYTILQTVDTGGRNLPSRRVTQDMLPTLIEFQQKEPSYKLLGFLSPSGQPLALTSTKWANVDFRQMDYFQEAAKGDHIYFSSPASDPLDKQPELVISRAVRDLKTKELVGVIFGVIDLRKVGEITYFAIRRSIEEKRYVFVTILDEGGLLLYDNGTSFSKFLKVRLSDNEVYQKVKHGGKGKRKEERIKNEEIESEGAFATSGLIPFSHEYGYIGGVQIGSDPNLEFNKWIILVSIQEVAFMEGLQEVKIKFIILLIAIVVFIPFFAVSLSRDFLEPIHELHRGSEVIGEGNLEHRIKIHTGNELQDLAEQFNHMAANLRNSYAKLEERVRERTSELQERNQDLQKARLDLLAKHEELSGAYVRLERLDIMKDEFVSTVSHELRTPLTAIKEGVSLIMDRVLPGEVTPEQDRVLQIAKKNIGRLETLIQDILDLSKLESGRMKLNKKELAVKQIVEGFIPTIMPLVEHKKLQLTYRLAENLPEVYADETRIVQVLTNLVGNGIKFTDSGGKINILVEPEIGGSMIRFAVEDTGKGIPQNDLVRIFEKFEQVDREVKPGVKGTGLGLPICKQIVELHGGSITVSSVLNQGSVFAFTLPAYSPAAVFNDGFKQLLNDYNQRKEKFAVIIILINNYRQISERYGREWGRILSEDVVQTLHERIRREDLLVELTDGSIAVLVRDPGPSFAQFKEKIDKLVSGQTHFHAQEEVRVEIVSGQAIVPDDGLEQEALLALARKRALGGKG